MKFTCLQENLTNALTKVYRAVPTKSELPILSNILISAQDNRIQISATNLSTTIITHIGASIETEGTITIPAKMLRDFVSNLSSTSIELALKDDVLHLISESTKSKFNGTSSEDFPELPEESKSLEKIVINPQIFYDAISSVSFCASLDDTRPVFTGIYISIDKGIMTLAASDGFRLSEIKIEIDKKAGKADFIIPAKTLMDISRVFSNNETEINLNYDTNNNLALFSQEDTLVATRIIDGQYPDYTRIIPSETSVIATFFAQELLEAVKLTDIFAKESDSALTMKINPKNKIIVSATAQESGEHTSEIKCEVEAKEEIEIGFNSKYLLDFLTHIKDTRITLKTQSSTTPCLFMIEGQENYLHIIMPMQIGNN